MWILRKNMPTYLQSAYVCELLLEICMNVDKRLENFQFRNLCIIIDGDALDPIMG